MSDESEEEEISEAIKALKPGNPKFFGFDDELKFYYVGLYKFKPRTVGLMARSRIRKQLAAHDKMAAKAVDEKTSASERIDLGTRMDEMQESLIMDIVPLLMQEGNGKQFNKKKWFEDSSPIPAGAWWDVLKDMYTFLRAKGSRAEVQLSLMPSLTK